MAITTYSELQTEVATWIRRSDLTSKIPTFIQLAESMIFRELYSGIFDAEVTLSTTQGLDYADLPTTGYINPIKVFITHGTRRVELYATQRTNMDVSTEAAMPHSWCISAGKIYFNCPLDSAYTVTMLYNKISPLSGSNTTNWLLTNHPDVYLWGALTMASSSIPGDARVTQWASMLDSAIAAVNYKESRGVIGPLGVGAGMQAATGNTYNVRYE